MVRMLMRVHIDEAPRALASLTQDPSRWSQGGGTRLPDSESNRGEPGKSTDRSDIRIEYVTTTVS